MPLHIRFVLKPGARDSRCIVIRGTFRHPGLCDSWHGSDTAQSVTKALQFRCRLKLELATSGSSVVEEQQGRDRAMTVDIHEVKAVNHTLDLALGGADGE